MTSADDGVLQRPAVQVRQPNVLDMRGLSAGPLILST